MIHFAAHLNQNIVNQLYPNKKLKKKKELVIKSYRARAMFSSSLLLEALSLLPGLQWVLDTCLS